MTEKVTIGNAELWYGDCLELMQSIPVSRNSVEHGKPERAKILSESDTATLLIAERTLDREARRMQSDLAAIRRELKRRKRNERRHPQ